MASQLETNIVLNVNSEGFDRSAKRLHEYLVAVKGTSICVVCYGKRVYPQNGHWIECPYCKDQDRYVGNRVETRTSGRAARSVNL